MTDLVSIDQLKIATGYDRPGDIERCLRKNLISNDLPLAVTKLLAEGR